MAVAVSLLRCVFNSCTRREQSRKATELHPHMTAEAERMLAKLRVILTLPLACWVRMRPAGLYPIPTFVWFHFNFICSPLCDKSLGH